jgi:hypothetical protein
MKISIALELEDMAIPTGYVCFDAMPGSEDVGITIRANKKAPDHVLMHEIHHAVQLARLFAGDKTSLDFATFHSLEQEVNEWVAKHSAS